MIARPAFCAQHGKRKNPGTWQRKHAGIDHKENQKVRKHEPRKAYCARTITVLLVEARAVHSFLERHVPMLLLLASKEQRSSSITARSMCGVHAAPRSMCGVAGCGIYTRRASAAGDLHTSWNQHIVEHSEQTVNHNTTLPRKVDKTRQKYKHESALFSALFRARRAVLHAERAAVRAHCAPPSRLVG